MKPSFTIDTSKFTAMCHHLANITGGQYEKAVEYEVAKVMEAAIRLTPAASLGRIRDRQENAQFSAQPEALYTPQSDAGRKARGKAKRLKGNLLLYYLGNKYPDQLWSAIVERRGAHLKALLKARGLAKRTWLELAKALGFDVASPGYVKKAIPSNPKVSEGTFRASMRIRREDRRSSISITIINDQPTIKAIRGQGILQRAINGRVRYFQTNLKKKVFDSLKTIAKRYPGIRTAA